MTVASHTSSYEKERKKIDELTPREKIEEFGKILFSSIVPIESPLQGLKQKQSHISSNGLKKE